MGRKKIKIKRIDDDKKRVVTFNKRKNGLLKKAYELAMLCDVHVALLVTSQKNAYEFGSADVNRLFDAYKQRQAEPHVVYTNKDVRTEPKTSAINDDKKT
jgi:hypothetical protein